MEEEDEEDAEAFVDRGFLALVEEEIEEEESRREKWVENDATRASWNCIFAATSFFGVYFLTLSISF